MTKHEKILFARNTKNAENTFQKVTLHKIDRKIKGQKFCNNHPYFYVLLTIFQGFEAPLWKKILGMKLTGEAQYILKQLLFFSLQVADLTISFVITGGKLDDITVIVGQVVSS